MTDTQQLIERLAGRAQPVTPIGSPFKRTIIWAIAAAILVALVPTRFGLRPPVWQPVTSAGRAEGVLPGVPIERQDPRTLLSMRSIDARGNPVVERGGPSWALRLALLAAVPRLVTVPLEMWFRRKGLLSDPATR